ncbi:MAG TPA: TrkA family potassium uptake protein [Mycobacteriales bacterium]|nr:TrkA family potassium uptake protein [Mycobacteriales bacterium]
MKAIIVGCGRVGSTLANRLSVDGHDVCVIDREPETRELLPAAFRGRFLVGNGYHRKVLDEAGITEAAAFVAVTSGDNTNIVAARIAREEYRVPQVIARIYDPRRADIYRDFGIPTVASVRWTVTRIQQMLLHRYVSPDITFGNGEAMLLRETLPAWFAGRPFTDLNVDGGIHATVVTRGGRAFLPTDNCLAEPDDEVAFVVATPSLGRLRSFLGKELGT